MCPSATAWQRAHCSPRLLLPAPAHSSGSSGWGAGVPGTSRHQPVRPCLPTCLPTATAPAAAVRVSPASAWSSRVCLAIRTLGDHAGKAASSRGWQMTSWLGLPTAVRVCWATRLQGACAGGMPGERYRERQYTAAHVAHAAANCAAARPLPCPICRRIAVHPLSTTPGASVRLYVSLILPPPPPPRPPPPRPPPPPPLRRRTASG